MSPLKHRLHSFLLRRVLGLVRSHTVETRAGGLLDVGLLTPGQGMPGA